MTGKMFSVVTPILPVVIIYKVYELYSAEVESKKCATATRLPTCHPVTGAAAPQNLRLLISERDDPDILRSLHLLSEKRSLMIFCCKSFGGMVSIL